MRALQQIFAAAQAVRDEGPERGIGVLDLPLERPVRHAFGRHRARAYLGESARRAIRNSGNLTLASDLKSLES